MPKEKLTEKIIIHISPELLEAVNAAADEKYMPRAQYIRNVLRKSVRPNPQQPQT